MPWKTAGTRADRTVRAKAHTQVGRPSCRRSQGGRRTHARARLGARRARCARARCARATRTAQHSPRR
eukprot:6172241-Pleurochrysis_carterae.AAC.1